ncbi:MAG TPA: adenylate kinase family protein [Candidatus Woesearchaeota archaeon]|nr:adenylate kinase family protein [Candidatus Woesearchaeota archaeon]
MIIAITGTPGTGKTRVSEILSKKMKANVINVSDFVKKRRLYEQYDRKLRTYIVDEKKLSRTLEKHIKEVFKDGNVIVDGHLSHYLRKGFVDVCIVLRCSITELNRRLLKRRYVKAKITDNLESEIFDICEEEARESQKLVITIDTSNKSASVTANEAYEIIKGLKWI